MPNGWTPPHRCADTHLRLRGNVGEQKGLPPGGNKEDVFGGVQVCAAEVALGAGIARHC